MLIRREIVISLDPETIKLARELNETARMWLAQSEAKAVARVLWDGMKAIQANLENNFR